VEDKVSTRVLSFVDKRFDGVNVSADGEEITRCGTAGRDLASMVRTASDDTLDLLADLLWHRIQDRLLTSHYVQQMPRG
jgi:hypothetical protein